MRIYFSHFTNKYFHDLTTKKLIPSVAAIILGFGLKFIPVSTKSIHQDDINKTIKQLGQDFYLKVFFANNNTNLVDEEPIEKLQVNSALKPVQPPHKFTKPIRDLEEAIKRNFRLKCRKSNLIQFQAIILRKIRSNKDVIIAHADKNLGPVGVNTKQYIRWALDEHLTNATTYVQVSEPFFISL
jgi:hypothetical protein